MAGGIIRKPRLFRPRSGPVSLEDFLNFIRDLESYLYGSDEMIGAVRVSAAGTAKLVGGRATILSKRVTTTCSIRLFPQDVNVLGTLRPDAVQVGIGFIINSTGIFDDGKVYWEITEPNP